MVTTRRAGWWTSHRAGFAGSPGGSSFPRRRARPMASGCSARSRTAARCQSVFDFPRADGSRRVIEYRTIWLPDERIYLCRWRELAVIDPGATPTG